MSVPILNFYLLSMPRNIIKNMRLLILGITWNWYVCNQKLTCLVGQKNVIVSNLNLELCDREPRVLSFKFDDVFSSLSCLQKSFQICYISKESRSHYILFSVIVTIFCFALKKQIARKNYIVKTKSHVYIRGLYNVCT